MFNIALLLTKISTNPISFQIKLSEERKKERKKIKLTRKKRLLNNEKGKIKNNSRIESSRILSQTY